MKSLWAEILERIDRTRLTLEKVFRPRDPESRVDFMIAFIALAAKLSKADGTVTRDEVSMFRSIVDIAPKDEKHAARVYNLCSQETAGYQTYARQLGRIIKGARTEDAVRENVMDGLFHIAMADGEYHPKEAEFLETIADILEMKPEDFAVLQARHVPEAWSPYLVLGVDVDASREEIKAAWRSKVREYHPDLLVSKGLPEEMIRLATERISDINKAYEEILPRMSCSVSPV